MRKFCRRRYLHTPFIFFSSHLKYVLVFICINSINHSYAEQKNERDTGIASPSVFNDLSPKIENLVYSYLSQGTRNEYDFEEQQNIESKPRNSKKVQLEILSKKVDAIFEDTNYAFSERLAIAKKIHELFPYILSDIDTSNTAKFIELLLDVGDTKSASILERKANSDASYLTIASTNYQLARYYFELHDTTKTLHYLEKIDTPDALRIDQQDFIQLMLGVTLQRKKQHRQAIKIYEKFSPKSHYYAYAQLNRALAFLLQGWWTDAQLAIESALEQDIRLDELDIKNRALLFLAYSQLKHEYYRNARNSLRKISLNSQYANKGLLAMGLAALNQKDYIGAINAFTRLRNTDSSELSVVEAYLMLAFTYESMGDLNEAELHYTQSLAFFAKNALEWNNKKNSLGEGARFIEEAEKTGLPTVQLNQIRFLQVTENYFRDRGDSNFTLIKNQLFEAVHQHIYQSHQKRIEHIQSYQSQAQFALARLYDANQ